MKGLTILRRFITSTWFLAAIPSLITFIFLPSSRTQSRLLLERGDSLHANYFYCDLNSDSISEVIHSGKGIPYFHILIQNNDLRVYDQWNFKDSMDIDLSDFFLGNYDNDKYKEIYAFTYKDDSLFLNINEFFDPSGARLERIFITTISIVNKKVTSTVCPAGFFDTDGDGKGELFFSIVTGFGVKPRRLYSYDIAHNKLCTSDYTGVMCHWPSLVDVNGDNRPEIFGSMSASGNYKTWAPYSDRSTWFMVFNDSLKLEFPPVEFPGLTNYLETYFYSRPGFKGFILSHNTGSADTSVFKPRVMVYSTQGKKIREILYSDLGLHSFTNLIVLKNKNADRIYLLGDYLMEISDELAILNKVKSPFNSSFLQFLEDINHDGQDEIVLYCPVQEKLVIYNASLQKIAESKLKATGLVFKFSHYLSQDHESRTFLSAGHYCYFLYLKSNIYYYLGYGEYPGIYFMFYLFLVIIKKINTHQVRQKERLKQRLITLQLKGIKAQLDPHFTFNTLNSVASLLYLDDRNAAYDYMNKFTQLLRNMLNDAERIYRSLEEEIAFVTMYLDLEKLRYGDKFDFKIETGEGVTLKEQVPKLVLHTFAENAVKHGITPKAEGGRLLIRAEKGSDCLRLFIEDNGIGMANSLGHSTSTGIGLKLTSEFYDILNQANKRPITYNIINLYDDAGKPSGTRVEVIVPDEVSAL